MSGDDPRDPLDPDDAEDPDGSGAGTPGDRPGEGADDADERPGGAPPDPMDRLWFHPSELGAPPAVGPVGRARRDLAVATVAATVGAIVTLVVLTAAGTLELSGSPSRGANGGVGFAPPAISSLSVGQIIATASPSIVSVHAAGPDPATTLDSSGVALGEREVLTHVGAVEGFTTFSVIARDRVHPATLVGIDPVTDLALLRIRDGSLDPARLGSSDSLFAGASVVGIGATIGEGRWVDPGIVNALGRLVTTRTGSTMAGLIQTNLNPATVVPGSALVDTSGEVVGILLGAAGASALPIDWARDVAIQLKTSGKAHHGWLGAECTDAPEVPGGGARVVTTVKGSPAERAGLSAGDVITAVADDRVRSTADLYAAILQRRPGDPVTLRGFRGRGGLRVQVTLTESGG